MRYFFLASANNQADQVVVSANRFEQPISSILAPVTVVTREDIDHWQSNTVIDVLRRLPGWIFHKVAEWVNKAPYLYVVQSHVTFWC